MMKRILLFFVTALCAVPAAAQVALDGELSSLVEAVCLLRGADEAAYDAVSGMLEADDLWTPMNETGAFRGQECPPWVRIPRFKLNRMLNEVGSDRKYVSTRGDMLNGEDPRYAYSLYERSIQAGATVSFSLFGREGPQVFVIVPYDADGGGLSASLSLEGSPEPVRFVPSGRGDGSLYAAFSDPSLNPGTAISITVTGGAADQAFVLLNHNSREK